MFAWKNQKPLPSVIKTQANPVTKALKSFRNENSLMFLEEYFNYTIYKWDTYEEDEIVYFPAVHLKSTGTFLALFSSMCTCKGFWFFAWFGF